MDKMKKRQLKKVLSWVCIVAVVGFLTAMPLIAPSGPADSGPKASILSGAVIYGAIHSSLHGGGTLSASEQTTVNLPTGVRIREFLVKNGEAVEEGAPLALADRISVMSAITGVQETMDYIMGQMSELGTENAPEELISLAGGRVKEIYAAEGEAVQDVMLRDGALAVLSLDGYMSVQTKSETSLVSGDRITVLLSDDSAVEGRVKSNLAGVLTVVIKDEDYPIGMRVTLTHSDGTQIGTGELQIHAPWNVVGYAGIIEEIHIHVGEQVEPEDVLISLKNTELTARRDALAIQYREYSDLMLRLFQMYQTEVIPSPTAGIVSGIDSDSIHLLSSADHEPVLNLLVNSPNGDDETLYLNFAALVTASENGCWDLLADLTPLSITDYRDLSMLELDPAKMTQPVQLVPTVPVFELADGEWTQIMPTDVIPGDYLLAAMDLQGNLVWVVRITEENRNPLIPEETLPPEDPTFPDTHPTTDPTDPSEPFDPSDPTVPSDPTDPTEPSVDPTIPSIPGIQYPDFQLPGGYEDILGSIGGFFGYGDYGSYLTPTPEEPEFEMYDLEGDVLMSVTGRDTIMLTILLDEQDISAVSPGQSAEVRIEALGDECYPAWITSIGRKGSNNGGSSKFSVELTMNRTETMLPGMSAIATIPLTAVEETTVIPIAALVELDAETVVYTGFDSSSGVLTNPVTVTVGASDAEFAQILSGLSAGDTFWYSYYDTLELSTNVELDSNPLQ